MAPRRPELRYSDPLDEIWRACARRIGFRVERTGEAYAAARGDGTIAIGAPELLDADDGLAQLLLHELCHALVEGEEAFARPDWGLDNTSDRDESSEQACLCVQAALLRPLGLRRVLAPTTEHRAFYDRLGDHPLAGDSDAVCRARIALGRAGRRPFAPHLGDALAATAEVVRAAAPFAAEASLFTAVDLEPDRHPTKFLLGGAGRCGDCAWHHRARGADRCRQAGGARIELDWPACDRHEPALDCQECGACCRAAYHSVTVAPRDPVRARHPELVEARDGYFEIRRDGDRCAALAVGGDGHRYACTIYDDRPRPCRDFEPSSANCLEARRRVGLSRA